MENKFAQESYKTYWINPRSNIPQNSSYTATYLPSLELFKSDEEDIQDTARASP